MNNPNRKQVNSVQWQKIKDMFTPVPETLADHVAFWETFKHPENLYARYRSGEAVGSIAASYYRSTQSLRVFFKAKYGERWNVRGEEQKRTYTKSPRMYSPTKAVTSKPVWIKTNAEIQAMINEGHTLRRIARRFNITPQTISYRITKGYLTWEERSDAQTQAA